MRDTEAVRLVGIISALCPGQKLAELTPEAWQLVLDDVSYDDAQQAVRLVYRRLAEKDDYQGYARIEAKDVLAEVRRSSWPARTAGVHPDALVPPDGLDTRQELEWIRNARRALREGRPVPDNGRQLGTRSLGSLTIGRNLD